ncbi:MAG: AraC family transcriptional regulator [Clostridiales bacterium]|nr:AraC family transcriptional regulator [Clostridiales bacterium]
MASISALQKNNYFDFEVTDFGFVNCYKNMLTEKNTAISCIRKDWSIVLVTSGNIHVNDLNLDIQKNQLFIFKPESLQDITYTQETCSYWLYIAGKTVDNIIQNLNIPLGSPCNIRNEKLSSLLDLIISEYLNKDVNYEGIALSLISSFLNHIPRELASIQKSGPSALKDVVVAMYQNPHISNQECAKMCFMSINHFIRIFKTHFGMTPQKFKQNIIITQAKDFLVKSQLSITEIAQTLGFTDNPLYFSDFFKSIVGMYPSNYRKLHAQNGDKKD